MARPDESYSAARTVTDSPRAYVAVDLGASTGRVMLGVLTDDRVELEECRRFETPLYEEDGHLFWDLDTIVEEVGAGVRTALEQHADVRSVSVDSWGVDYVRLDERGRPLHDPYSYRDDRTETVMEAALERVDRAKIYGATGIQFMPINTLYQVLADRRARTEDRDRTALHVPIADYVNHRLGGRIAAEETLASTTQLLHPRSRSWSTALMEAFEIDPNGWPEVVPPGTVLGTLSEELRTSAAGRSEEVPVVLAGCSHDTACAVAGAPIDRERGRAAFLSCGTWSLLGIERDAPLLTEEARRANFTNELGYGGRVRFLKNITGLWVLQECVRRWENEGRSAPYEVLLEEAEAAAPLEATVDLADRRFSTPGEMPAKIRAYCREQGHAPPENRGETVRCVLESLAALHAETTDTLEALVDAPIERIHLFGGGSRNPLLCRWTAEASGREVVAGPAEATALGNVLVQAKAMGDLPADVPLEHLVRQSVSLERYSPSSSR